VARPMTMQGKMRCCARNVFSFARENHIDLAHYWGRALRRHLESEAGKKTVLTPEVKRLVDRALAKDVELETAPMVPLADTIPVIKIKPKTYTINDAAISKVAERLADMIHDRARKQGNGLALNPVAEAVRQAVIHHIKKEATCVS